MTAPHRGVAGLVAGLLASALGLSALSGAADARPVEPYAEEQAVVAVRGALPSLAGVRVTSVFPAVGAAVVRGEASAIARLTSAPGVIAVRADDPLELTDDTLEPVKADPAEDAGAPDQAAAPSPGEADLPVAPPSVAASVADEPLGGVLASRGLGSPAGTAGAGEGIRVAVLDTGVSDTPALDRASGRLVDGVDTSPVRDGGEPLTDGATEGPFTDGYGHGTYMASVLAGGPVSGSQGRALGVVPGATVVVVKVADNDGSTSLSQVLAGLDWVIDHRAEIDVVNVSLAAALPTGDYAPDPLVVAIERVRRAGVVPVVAAGNQAGTLGDPGFSPRAITVGAVDLDTRTVTDRSGSGMVAGFRKPDVVANGRNVLGVLPADSVLAREHPGAHLAGDLWRGSGTSQATAVVSGVSALVLQQWPGSTPGQLAAFLHANAVDIPGDTDGAGMVARPRFLRSPSASPPVMPVVRPDEGNGGGDPAGGPWSADSWSADSWSADSWSADSWSADSWSADSWSADSWSADSWSADSWSADSWSADSWSADSWSADSWSADSWSADSWSSDWTAGP